jgi:hypothetical protein
LVCFDGRKNLSASPAAAAQLLIIKIYSRFVPTMPPRPNPWLALLKPHLNKVLWFGFILLLLHLHELVNLLLTAVAAFIEAVLSSVGACAASLSSVVASFVNTVSLAAVLSLAAVAVVFIMVVRELILLMTGRRRSQAGVAWAGIVPALE